MASLNIFTKPVVDLFRRTGGQISLRCHSGLRCRKLQGRSYAFNGRGFSDSHPNILRSTLPDIELPGIPLHEYVFQSIARHENKIAILRLKIDAKRAEVGERALDSGRPQQHSLHALTHPAEISTCAATGKKWTYKELLKNSKNLAASYRKKFNLKKGDRQIVVLPNCPEYTSLFLGGSMVGIVTSTANPIYSSTEISHQLSIVQPKILFTTPDTYNKCSEALTMAKFKVPIVVVKSQPEEEIPPGAISYAELAESTTPVDFNPVNIDVNDDVVIPFSSGTSGLPKGVQLSHKCITSNLAQYGTGNTLTSNPNKETNQSIILGILPMFHIYGMVVVTLDALRCGAHLVCLPKFEQKLFVDTIYTHKTEILYLVPPLVFFLANNPMVEPKHLQFVQHVVSGAAPCGDSDAERLLKKCATLDIRQGYGMTETSPLITVSCDERAHKRASVGHPVASTLVKIADPQTGEPLPQGSQGEIRVKGPQVMKGYLNDPEATRRTFDSEGWLQTGDIGYCDDEGDLFVVDRLKELIKVKGFQVAPAELEEILRTHPKVADVAVVGVAHPELGEAPKAFVVVKKGSSAKEEEIRNYMKERLTSYKQLKGGVEFVEAIPRNSAGKILRRKLRNLSS